MNSPIDSAEEAKEMTMCPQSLNTIGLIFNMAGVLILFRYGFPQPTHEEGTSLAIQGPVADKNAQEARRIKRKYLVLL